MRRRALRVFLLFLFAFVTFFYLANYLFNFIIHPLLVILPNSNSLIATTVTGPVFAQLDLALNFSLLVTIPFFLYQVWLFVYPALYKKEIFGIGITIICSGLLFFLGIFSCYFLILPMIFKFFIGAIPQQVILMPDINYTIDFIFRMMLVFGLCFQLPLIMFVLVKTGLLKVSTLQHYRSHFIVIAFVIGMIFTPPDVFSQVMLALPMVVLYEIGILATRSTAFSRIIVVKDR